MYLSSRETWTAIHGIVFGAAFLLSFTGGLVTLLEFRVDPSGKMPTRWTVARLKGWTLAMAVLVWGTVLLGTYLIYPWYRAKAPPGAALARYPRNQLLADPHNAAWHTFGMEWKEHLSWFAPILVTALAYLVLRHWRLLLIDRRLRHAGAMLLTAAFCCAVVAGVLGAFINKMAPLR